MIWFLLGALLSFGAFTWAGWGRHWKIWIAGFIPLCLAALSFEYGGEPFVVMISLFLVGTIARLLVGIRSGMVWMMAPTALSDVLLALAFSTHYAASFDWGLPAPGEWGAGAVLVGLAAVARGGTAAFTGEPRGMAISSLSLWEGAFLAWWVGGGASPLLILSALVFAFFAWRMADRGAPMLGVAIAFAVSSLGVPAIAATGVAAGTALALGDRLLSVWTLGLLPMSLLTRTNVELNAGVLVVLIVLPSAWLASLAPSLRANPARTSGATVAMFGAIGSISGITPAGVYWLLYAALLAFGLSRLLVETSPPTIRHIVGEGRRDHGRAWLPAVAWSLVAVSWVLLARLLLLGQRTSFL